MQLRQLRNAILHVHLSGCQWAVLPKGLAPKSRVRDDFSRWESEGTIARLHHALYVHALYVAVRDKARREASPTTAIIGDRRPQPDGEGGAKGSSWLDLSGCDAGKTVVGRKHDAGGCGRSWPHLPLSRPRPP